MHFWISINLFLLDKAKSAGAQNNVDYIKIPFQMFLTSFYKEKK